MRCFSFHQLHLTPATLTLAKTGPLVIEITASTYACARDDLVAKIVVCIEKIKKVYI